MRNVVLQTGGGALGPVAEWLQNLSPAEGAVLALVVGLILGVGSKHLWDRFTADDEPDMDFADVLDEETLKEGEAERQLLDDISESHKSVTAPGAVEWETRAARVGEQWTTTLYIANYADYPNDGYLSDLFEMTDVQFDLTAHITPKNQERARNELQDIADDLQVDADLEQSIRSAYLQERANEAAATYKAVENGANVFDQGMFITVRTDEKDHLRDAVQTVKSALGTTRRTSRRRPRFAGRTSPSNPPRPSATTSSAGHRSRSVAPSARYCPPRTTRRSSRRAASSSAFTKTTRAPSSSTPSPETTGTRCSPSATRARGSRSAQAELYPLHRAEQGPHRNHPRTAEQLGRCLRGARRQANHGRRDTRPEPSGNSRDARARPAGDG